MLPPTVYLDPSSSTRHIRRIGWRFEIETNRRESLFERDWIPVDGSRWQVAAALDGRSAAFTPLSIKVQTDARQTTELFRVRVIVEWYTRNDEVAGRAELIPTSYREGNQLLTGSWPAFCSGVL